MRRLNYLDILTNELFILFFLYTIPFVGIILIIIRLFSFKRKKDNLGLYLIIFGALLCLPNLINNFYEIESIVNNDIYSYLYSDVKFIIGTGVVLLIISSLFDKLKLKIMSLLKTEQKKNYNIDKENNLKIKEKQERAKTTHVIICPYCGSDNIISGNIGKCRHCRRSLQKKEN